MAKRPPEFSEAASEPEEGSRIVTVAPEPASIAPQLLRAKQAQMPVASSDADARSPTDGSTDNAASNIASGDGAVALALPSDSAVAVSYPAGDPTGNHSSSSASPFIKLSSTEIRIMIYRYLLSAVECDNIRPGSGRFHFELNILRVSRHTYAEGSKVLYGENKWVMFSENTGMLLVLLRMAKLPTIRLGRQTDFGRLEKGHRKPALHMSLFTRSPLSWSPTCFVVPLNMMRRVCCWLSTEKTLREESKIQLDFAKEQYRRHEFVEILSDFREAYNVQVSRRAPPTVGAELIRRMKGPRDGAKQRTMLAQAFLMRADTHWTVYTDSRDLENSVSPSQFAFASSFYLEGAQETMAAIEAYRQGKLTDADDAAVSQLTALRGELLASMVLCTTFGNDRNRGDVRRMRQALSEIIGRLSTAQDQRLLAAVLKSVAKLAVRPQDHYLQLWALFETVRKGLQDAEAGQMIASFQRTVEGNQVLKSLLDALLRPAFEDKTCWVPVLTDQRIRQLVIAAIEYADKVSK
ncbi:MAG: hypothetical protein Q9207_005607 [Kuettlingeria erythrocarpa]